MDEAREAFRSNRDVEDEAELDELIKLAESKVAFLRMTTPKVAQKKLPGHKSDRAQFVVGKDGSVIEDSAEVRTVTGSHGNAQITQEDWNRHQQLQERMHFKGPFWEGKF
eukprot:TRINITY_DN67476_c2_g1_i2.p3 TRINITY_DN67476_c2_g1~~TRINITY_DN67476_c2_g1_i2.p3  ORF type:complete len:110 (+),score=70.49 TRINITY_DN67476_c2_g1_i2:705-1034(+)